MIPRFFKKIAKKTKRLFEIKKYEQYLKISKSFSLPLKKTKQNRKRKQIFKDGYRNIHFFGEKSTFVPNRTIFKPGAFKISISIMHLFKNC